MHDFRPHSALLAQRILDAWEQEDMPGLRAELSYAQRPCFAASPEEEERLELLDGIAAQVEQDLAGSELGNIASVRTATCVRLLEHLATSSPHAAIRSGELSSFPCSRSVRKISACH